MVFFLVISEFYLRRNDSYDNLVICILKHEGNNSVLCICTCTVAESDNVCM